ncbi:MAG TPA: hypothetical protein VFS39_17995 [Nitrospira sp.]|nr:hypothetical protein [Nitrospira sp.]
MKGVTAGLLAVLALGLSGCPRLLSLDYRPSTTVQGSGTVRVDRFVYEGHPTGLMKRKEVESEAKDPEALYLWRDIGDFFTDALKAELTRAGYAIDPVSGRVISGTILHFFLDYIPEHDQQFQIKVRFYVARRDAAIYETTCHSARQQAKDWMKSGQLIEQGVRLCIEEFLRDAQAAGVL